MHSYFITGQPPIRVVADAAVPGSGPMESGPTTPNLAGWHELAANGRPRLGTLDAVGFLRLLPDDAIVTGTAVVPAVVAGADLAVFPLGLFGMYLSRPGLPDVWSPSGAPVRWDHP